jgi:hypothetical protein
MTLPGRALGSSTLPAPKGKGDIAVGMENFKPYDSADYLETEEALAALIRDDVVLGEDQSLAAAGV